ncbi:MAG: hypothetical protein OXF25_08170 [Cyanobacteria bacterium MAG CAR3_bin_5]|nr:hypothetical protein [Cyanobacteria bacterium MAG CAR3_bin_5]MCY4235549.1 hypothetical protein [Cyanobacteria bacterium MAG CAR2_bin_4]
MTPAVALALSPTTNTTILLWSLAPYSPQQGHIQPWAVSLEGEREEHSYPTLHSLNLRFSSLF